ncbi:hypothetical protein KM043_012376 [Ampulex compressa]|nr:hypothetical protein KM043_012376 [Ampulex compressa]
MTHRSLRRKSKVGTDLSSPSGEGAIDTDDGEVSETLMETSFRAASAASSRERSRSVFIAPKRRESACKSSIPSKIRIISLYKRETGAGADVDVSLEISGLSYEFENLRAELDRYWRAEEDASRMPPSPPAEVVQREELEVVMMVDTVTGPSSERPLAKKQTPLRKNEIQRMIEESVGAAVRVFSTNLEKTIGEHIGRALGDLLPLLPQVNSGDGVRKNIPKAATHNSPEMKGAVSEQRRSVSEAKSKSRKSRGRGKGAK